MSLHVRAFGVGAVAVLILLAGASPARAQGSITSTTQVSSDDTHGGVGIGVKFGPLFSSLSSEAVTDPLETRTGWIGGLFIGGNRPGLIGVGVDLLYARKKVGTPIGDATLDYLSIPVLLRVNAGSRTLDGVNVYAQVGPSFEVHLKDTIDFGEDVDDQVSAVDFGLAVGAGVEITRFIVEGRYTRGFRSLSEDLQDNEKITTQSFAIMFGVRFN